MSTYDVRPAAERQRTETDWLSSSHSFSFGPAYDPANLGFGLLLVNNDDVLAPGAGFDTHPHRDMEIVTWVLSGALVHQDSEGHHGAIYPGLAQRMSAGSGILHSERNDAAGDPAHFVQMWVTPHDAGIEPGYQQLEVGELLASGQLVPIASGLARHRHQTAIEIHQRDAGLSLARLEEGGTVCLPAAPYVHLFVARGEVDVESVGPLSAGDALRLTGSAGQRVGATESAEILVWEMHSTLL